MTVEYRSGSLFMPRPESGFAAWQIMIGYISRYVSPDVRLKFVIRSNRSSVSCDTVLYWNRKAEQIRAASSLADAMRRLWSLVDHYHAVIHDPTLPTPADYDLATWFDTKTQDILQRLILTNGSVFKDNWQIVAIYRPVEIPDLRVQMRLTAVNNLIQVGGRGPSIAEAARQLFNNAAPALALYAQQQFE